MLDTIPLADNCVDNPARETLGAVVTDVILVGQRGAQISLASITGEG
jgi:hypothetical protein